MPGSRYSIQRTFGKFESIRGVFGQVLVLNDLTGQIEDPTAFILWVPEAL